MGNRQRIVTTGPRLFSGGGLVRVVQVVDERNVEVEDATENGAGSVFTADIATLAPHYLKREE
jgi:hypothetical protein